MTEARLASIIVSSYNYGRFLGAAIDSALNQTYPNTEVIVVDDGSTDNSRQVIAGYGNRIIPLLKENGGQASAFNAGFAASRGEVIFFLDSDDMLRPIAVANAMRLFDSRDVAKVHWPLWVVDQHGNKTGEINSPELPEGDLRGVLVRGGPEGYAWPPTSGNAWARRFIESIFPMPEEEYRICPDFYLSALVPLYGSLGRLQEPQGYWRVHGGNSSWRRDRPFVDRLEVEARRLNHCFDALGDQCKAMGLSADPSVWKTNSWIQAHRAAQEFSRLIPPGASFILVDEESWGAEESIAGRRRIPFLELDGEYWGPPPDDETAVSELERLRHAGASFMAFVWPHLWWLDHYAGLHRHLRSQYRCLQDSDHLVLFDLRP